MARLSFGSRWRSISLPVTVFAILLGVWSALVATGWFPESALPRPWTVVLALQEDILSGRLSRDTLASLFRVGAGYILAVAVSLPLGMLLGSHLATRAALLPALNFFRNLSPLAWMPFAILWFGIGDAPVVFLIFLASVFPLTLAVTAAIIAVPSVYYQVARDYNIRGAEVVTSVLLPAILPQFITALRVTAGIAWMVVVAAEMLAGRDGLGFAIWDARNGLRTDLLMSSMVVIGVLGVLIDRLLSQLHNVPSVRWGYER